MSVRTVYEGACCVDCALFLANGEVSPGVDEDALVAAIVRRHPPPAYPTLACDGNAHDCDPFSSAPCDCCGSLLAGERHRFVVLT